MCYLPAFIFLLFVSLCLFFFVPGCTLRQQVRFSLYFFLFLFFAIPSRVSEQVQHCGYCGSKACQSVQLLVVGSRPPSSRAGGKFLYSKREMKRFGLEPGQENEGRVDVFFRCLVFLKSPRQQQKTPGRRRLRLRWAIEGYRGLQRATEGYRGLQRAKANFLPMDFCQLRVLTRASGMEDLEVTSIQTDQLQKYYVIDL